MRNNSFTNGPHMTPGISVDEELQTVSPFRIQ